MSLADKLTTKQFMKKKVSTKRLRRRLSKVLIDSQTTNSTPQELLESLLKASGLEDDLAKEVAEEFEKVAEEIIMEVKNVQTDISNRDGESSKNIQSDGQ